MREIRFATNEDLIQAAALSDSVFRDAEQTSMGVAFPQIFTSGLNQSVAAFEDGKLVAFMGLVPNIIKIGHAQLLIHSLGSVCTDPAYRGKGHASLILDQIYQFIKDSGSSLLLVSGERTLYTRSGCRRFGSIKHYVITEQDAAMLNKKTSKSKPTFRLLQVADTFGLHALRKNNPVSYEESLFGTAQLIGSAAFSSIFRLDQKVYVAELDGELIASAIVAVPGKLATEAEPFVVEWNGHAGAAASLIAHVIQAHSLNKINLFSPWQELDLHLALEGVTAPTTIQNNGTIKIIDADKLLKQLMPHLIEKNPEAAGAIRIVGSDAPEVIRLLIRGDAIQISYDEFIELLFNPAADIPALEPYKSVTDSLFPIAFPYTAGLHYV